MTKAEVLAMLSKRREPNHVKTKLDAVTRQYSTGNGPISKRAKETIDHRNKQFAEDVKKEADQE